ncbi:unnamed protein product [Acanthoscelides obtectus]|uniref:Uncharacterized protein n=1 Tax=Acanthoscelides obtectus TaxID=200917 RepID=A0A9P0K899_ACAOB|nr:unnamed protein product [Acanthoscelides obtectus]CAK1655465.1 hypothetical protein AOBTE_LOCUS19183 [Acanthoscelides obtectus]
MNLRKHLCFTTYFFSYLVGSSSWKPVKTNSVLRFITFQNVIPAVIRNMIFGTIFLSCTFWRLKLFVLHVNIIRSVFILCTLSVPFIVLLNSTLVLMYRLVHTNMLNKLIFMIEGSSSKKCADVFERNFHIIQILSIIVVFASLATLDFSRNALEDLFSYTFFECLLLWTVLDKINILLLTLKLLKNLTENTKKSDLLTVVESCKQHLKIKGMMKLYGTINRWFFLCLSVYAFVWVTYNLHKFIVLHFFDYKKFPTRSFTISAISTWLWTSLQLFHLASIILTYHKISEADEIFRSSVRDTFTKLDLSEKYSNIYVVSIEVNFRVIELLVYVL